MIIYICVKLVCVLSRRQTAQIELFQWLPEELNLTDLEQVLISIFFLKLWKLPKSIWINVPITDDDIVNKMSKLPRTPKDAGIIALDFKRKVYLKSSVLKQYIDVHKVGPALKALKSIGQPSYQFIDLNGEYLNAIERDCVCNENTEDNCMNVIPESESCVEELNDDDVEELTVYTIRCNKKVAIWFLKEWMFNS